MKKLNYLIGLLLVGGMAFTSCVNEDNPSGNDEWAVKDIPSDKDATPNPVFGDDEINATIPNFNYSISEENGWAVVRLDMTGIKDPFTNDWVELYGTKHPKQNVWVSVDGVPKGFTIEKVDNGNTSAVDLVFLVDNSGSMGQEAEGLARDITNWAMSLNEKLDIRFGCVGYGYNVGSEYPSLINNYGVSGALNLTSFENLDAFLNNRGYYGTQRTVGYAGADSETLSALAAKDEYSKAGGECGIQALRFADENFNFRTGANRIYVNFTDDANYTGGNKDISIDYVKNVENWPATKGTIHSVISNSASRITARAAAVGGAEISWLPSDYTGGTTIYVPSDFSGVTLDDLPVTGALLNSYIIRFTNVAGVLDGQAHKVWITVKSESPNGEILANKEYDITFIKE